MAASDQTDQRVEAPEWVGDGPPGGSSPVATILGPTALASIDDLEASWAARADEAAEAPTTHPASRSIADLTGPINAAVARHAAVVAEPLGGDALPPRPASRPVVAPRAGPSAAPLTAVTTHSPAANDTAAPDPSRPVEVHGGRDWDVELARSAELSPLISRSGVSPRSASDDPLWRATDDPALALLPTPTSLTDPSVVTLAALVADAETAAAMPRDTPTRTSAPSTTGRLDPLEWLRPTEQDDPDDEIVVPVLAAAGRAPGIVPHQHEAGLVTGDVIDLLEMDDIPLLSDDPMAVPLRPVAEPILGTVATSAPATSRRGRRRPRGGSVVITPPSQHRVRRALRLAARIIVILAVLAGLAFSGYLAVQHFVLAKRWPVSLQPVSQHIEERTGLEFDRAIPVVEVRRGDFESRASEVRLGLPIAAVSSEGSVADVMAPERALGLWSGRYDAEAAARVAAKAWPAVYDPSSKTVYVDGSVVDGDRRKAAVARELTMGLFDQAYGWSGTVGSVSGGQALALRTRLEAEALQVASSYFAGLSDRPVPVGELASTMPMPEVNEDAWGAVPDAEETDLRVPLVGGASLATGTLDGLDGFNASDEQLLFGTTELMEPPQLGPVLDTDVVAAGIGPQGAQGVSFWLSVLFSRIDVDRAVGALDGYRSDAARTLLTDTDGDGVADRVCVDARIRMGSTATGTALQSALEDWAGLAPAQAATTVSRPADTIVALRSCDPGVGTSTATRTSAAFDTVWLTATRAAEIGSDDGSADATPATAGE